MTDPREGLLKQAARDCLNDLPGRNNHKDVAAHHIHAIYAPHLRAPLTDEDRGAVAVRLSFPFASAAFTHGFSPLGSRDKAEGERVEGLWREGDRIIREHFGLSETEGGEK